jgi:hypothetical protein
LRHLRRPGEQGARVRFENVSGQAGPFFQCPREGRGVAFGDLDNDGRVDAVISYVNEPAVVLQNGLDNGHHWLGVELVGKPNRDAVGARVTLEVAGQTLLRTVKGGGSYLSASDRRIVFGLGTHPSAGRLTVHWPSGKVHSWQQLAGDRYWRCIEGEPSAQAVR